MSLVLSKGVDYVIAQLPNWISRKEISREDIELILMYAMMSRLDELGRKIDDLRKEVIDGLDLISNQLRVLNSNIAATYELTSKVMTKLMESNIAPAHTLMHKTCINSRRSWSCIGSQSPSSDLPGIGNTYQADYNRPPPLNFYYNGIHGIPTPIEINGFQHVEGVWSEPVVMERV
jgi:hypothetical protein